MALSESFGAHVEWMHPYFEAHASGFLEGYLAYIDDYIAYLEDPEEAEPSPNAFGIDRLRHPTSKARTRGYRGSDFFSREQTQATLETYRDFRELLHGFMERIEGYEATGRQMIEKALMLAIQAHQGKLNRKGELRKSDGAPYIKHCLLMAEKLLVDQVQSQRAQPKASIIVAILLHDTVEDARLGPDYPEVPEESLVQPQKSPPYHPLNTRERWLAFIRQEFDATGEGELIARWIDAVTEIEPDGPQRKEIQSHPLYKVFHDFAQRGGTLVPKAGTTPLSENDLEKLESVVFNLQRLFDLLLENPEHLPIALIKILDIAQNFEEPEMIKPVKILRGRVAANLAEWFGWFGMRSELLIKLGYLIDFSTPNAAGTFPADKHPLKEAPSADTVLNHLREQGNFTRLGWSDVINHAYEALGLPPPKDFPSIDQIPYSCNHFSLGFAVSNQPASRSEGSPLIPLPELELTINAHAESPQAEHSWRPEGTRDHMPRQNPLTLLDAFRRQCGRQMTALVHDELRLLIRTTGSRPTLMDCLGHLKQEDVAQVPEAHLTWAASGGKDPKISQAHQRHFLQMMYNPLRVDCCLVHLEWRRLLASNFTRISELMNCFVLQKKVIDPAKVYLAGPELLELVNAERPIILALDPYGDSAGRSPAITPARLLLGDTETQLEQRIKEAEKTVPFAEPFLMALLCRNGASVSWKRRQQLAEWFVDNRPMALRHPLWQTLAENVIKIEAAPTDTPPNTYYIDPNAMAAFEHIYDDITVFYGGAIHLGANIEALYTQFVQDLTLIAHLTKPELAGQRGKEFLKLRRSMRHRPYLPRPNRFHFGIVTRYVRHTLVDLRHPREI